jgi:quinol monooxygenase YgiN
MLVLAVTWLANPGREKEVAVLFEKLQTASRREAGCVMYIVHRHVDDTRRFFIYEQYRDADALEAHRDSLHFQQYAVKALREIAERVNGDLYKPLTEK